MVASRTNALCHPIRFLVLRLRSILASGSNMEHFCQSYPWLRCSVCFVQYRYFILKTTTVLWIELDSVVNTTAVESEMSFRWHLIHNFRDDVHTYVKAVPVTPCVWCWEHHDVCCPRIQYACGQTYALKKLYWWTPFSMVQVESYSEPKPIFSIYYQYFSTFKIHIPVRMDGKQPFFCRYHCTTLLLQFKQLQ